MADDIKIQVPDIGGATDVDVIEILVKPGDKISKDTALITLESDKASMEIPSPKEGEIQSIAVKVGDKVSEGSLILTLKSDATHSPAKEEAVKEESKTASNPKEEPLPSKDSKSTKKAGLKEVTIPDIGGASDVDVIEVMVKVGQAVEKEEALITLEGDKATMEIPSPAAGKVKELKIKVGDKVSEGSLILVLETEELEEEIVKPEKSAEAIEVPPVEQPKNEAKSEAISTTKTEESSPSYGSHVSAGPAVRRLAREFGVNLNEVKGTSRKGRISKDDLQLYVKTKLAEKQEGGLAIPSAPVIDFSKFGEIETKPLNKIKRLTGVNVHRSWVTIPHVTQFDEADITDLEAFRKNEAANSKDSSYKLTILAFVTKVVARALAAYPQFNASLDAKGENLIYKKYCHIGIAVETPNGLVVPVIKDADKLSVVDIAKEMARLSAKARDKGLMPADMSGGCFTISSLGGIGGTAFTPIVNSPEVAILGLSRSTIKPVYIGDEFKPRLMLPLSLSYDHRVIDGAEAARFTRFIGDCLSDIRRILL
ncbi:MAG: dihydrolipoyllysine-residue acetyltransferase [Proteobacteria bacterium]|nr:dihydrolipoyllysine-residue acetyltransferase [Pseudomonadota bacterium]